MLMTFDISLIIRLNCHLVSFSALVTEQIGDVSCIYIKLMLDPDLVQPCEL